MRAAPAFGHQEPRWLARLALRLGSLLAAGVVVLGPLALAGAAAGPLNMNAQVLLQGHARSGTWAAIEIDLQNDGPQIRGELQMDGGSQSNARYSMAVDLPTNSRKTYVLHAQPPAFGRNVTVDLVADGQKIESVTVAYLVHEATQLVVGVLAEQAGAIASQINLPSSTSGVAPAVVPLTIADLLSRVESVRPRPTGLAGRRRQQPHTRPARCPASLDRGGGRLVIVGGSAGIGTLSAFPDAILPYRPTATVDADPAVLTSPWVPRPTARRTSSRWRAPWWAGVRSRPRGTARSRPSWPTGPAASRSSASIRRPVAQREQGRRGAVAKHTPCPDGRRRPPRRRQPADPAVYQLPALALPPTEGLLDHQVHPHHRPDQLPDPEAPRPAGAGLGHDACARACLRGRGVRMGRSRAPMS